MHYNTLKTKTQASLKKYKGDFVRTQTQLNIFCKNNKNMQKISAEKILTFVLSDMDSGNVTAEKYKLALTTQPECHGNQHSSRLSLKSFKELKFDDLIKDKTTRKSQIH